MAKQRYVNTKFWRDSYIENLDPTEKLLFLYLLTNPDTNICGIYELPLKIIAVDTGIDKNMVSKLFDRFEADNKIRFKDGWVCFKNFIAHQTLSPKIKAGILSELNKAPKNTVLWAYVPKEIGYAYPIQDLSHLNLIKSNLIKSNTKVSEKEKPVAKATINPYQLANKSITNTNLDRKYLDALVYAIDIDKCTTYSHATNLAKTVLHILERYEKQRTTSKPPTVAMIIWVLDDLGNNRKIPNNPWDYELTINYWEDAVYVSYPNKYVNLKLRAVVALDEPEQSFDKWADICVERSK